MVTKVRQNKLLSECLKFFWYTDKCEYFESFDTAIINVIFPLTVVMFGKGKEVFTPQRCRAEFLISMREELK